MLPLKKLYNRLFVRVLLTSFGFRAPGYFSPDEFPTYFQYRIGPYEPGYMLCFRRRPSLHLYKMEIFEKMREYSGYDVIKYVHFHYDAFADKEEFLRFLHYEVTERLKWGARRKVDDFAVRLEIVREWMEEERGKLGVAEPVARAGEPASGEVASAADEGDEVGQPYAAGRIRVHHEGHLERVIQLFVLLQKAGAADGRMVFKRFSDVDLAAMLRPMEGLGDKKVNTLQKKIADARWRLGKSAREQEAASTMLAALSAFFYGDEVNP